MSRHIVIALCFLVLTQFAHAQSLSGYVLNRQTGEPISNAAIFISGTTMGSTSDSTGYFSVETPFLPTHFPKIIFLLQRTK